MIQLSNHSTYMLYCFDRIFKINHMGMPSFSKLKRPRSFSLTENWENARCYHEIYLLMIKVHNKFYTFKKFCRQLVATTVAD